MNKSSLPKGNVLSNRVAVWFLWVIVNTVGAALAVGIIFLALSIPGIDEDKALAYIAIPAFGLLISIAQFMLLCVHPTQRLVDFGFSRWLVTRFRRYSIHREVRLLRCCARN